MPDRTDSLNIHRVFPIRVGGGNLIEVFGALLDAVTLVCSLWFVAQVFDRGLDTSYLVLSLLVFALTFPGSARLDLPPSRVVRHVLFQWMLLLPVLLFFGWATHHLSDFSEPAIVGWALLAPVSMVVANLAFRAAVPSLVAAQGGAKRCVIAGMNEQGMSLARGLRENPYSPTTLVGFFDDRSKERLLYNGEFALLGHIDDLPKFVRAHRVHVIYLALPMATQPRIQQLLADLRDTTASIYFVPDIFITDLIQGRMSAVAGMPVVAVCESPFVGLDGLMKRASDIVLSVLIILMLSPLLIAIAIGVKLSSPGPIIFKQRRYGLDGQEIMVFKFRSMTVTEDGEKVYKQVTRDDARVTHFGAFIRRTSLDELPQFFNVLMGRMSIVGPRPHAIAVNEQYRRQISGYMVRHKVRPGITGWAQIHGLRGGDDLDSMRRRVEYDLDYLRNWSLRLDLYIILKTALILFRDDLAY